MAGADLLTVDTCTFEDNWAQDYAGAVFLHPARNIANTAWHRLAEANFVDCTFYGNEAADFNGGAVYTANAGDGAATPVGKAITFDGCDFVGNESNKGGGAIWVLTERSPDDWHTILDLTDCKFIGNIMNATGVTDGGGAVFLSGNANHDPGDDPGIVEGTWTNCDFIGNLAERGGGAYIHNTYQIDIRECRFIANGDELCKAGGGIGIGDPANYGETDVRVCKSTFVSNFAIKGGAVHNHEGATTYMVNCRITGNNSTQEGGGVFNSRHTGENAPAELYMHNCLIAGNIAENGSDNSDRGGGVFNGLEGNEEDTEAILELVHCTLLGNYAGYKYGGGVNVVENSFLRVRNCILWDNLDADGSETVVDQLHYVANLQDEDVDNNVIDHDTNGETFEVSGGEDEENTEDDPDFIDNGAGSVSWTAAAYDPTTGKTTFTTTNTGGAAVNELFKPSTSDTKMLVIASVVANTSVTCWGYWADGSGTAKLYDLQIVDSGSAYDFGGSDHVPDDFCDLDNNPSTEELPFDLYINGRVSNAAPDCGVHEIAVSSFGGG